MEWFWPLFLIVVSCIAFVVWKAKQPTAADKERVAHTKAARACDEVSEAQLKIKEMQHRLILLMPLGKMSHYNKLLGASYENYNAQLEADAHECERVAKGLERLSRMPLDSQWEIDFNRLAVLIPELQDAANEAETSVSHLENKPESTERPTPR